MYTEELIKQLLKVKLVIGNGFDLMCGLKSSYNDFFNAIFENDEEINNFINTLREKSHHILDFNIANYNDYYPFYYKENERTIWEYYFYLKHLDKKGKNYENWSDIENEIEVSLMKKNEIFKEGWLYVYKLLSKNDSDVSYVTTDVKILVAIIHHKSNYKSFKSDEEFYIFLLNELILFEKKFGKYIKKQRYKNVGNKVNEILLDNRNFIMNSDFLLNKLVDMKNLVSIDSFNYDNLHNDYLNIFHNINGDIENPIFGIDSDSFDYEDPRFIFTKTYRRMQLQMSRNQINENVEFNNVVIFGHSLSKADYNYFFSLFDKIDLTNIQNTNKVIFAYYIYDKNNEENIRKTLRKNVFKLIENYAIYTNFSSSKNRLSDILTTQNKIIMYEIY